MKTYKRVLAVILCVVMTLTAAPLSGFVGLELPSLFDFEADAASYSGTCGDNLTWTFDTSTGVLNITGTGAMYNWSKLTDLYSPSPWDLYDGYIKTVNIEDGVTTIGDWAFSGFTGLTSVTIPDSVTIISDYAFHICSSLSNITIPNSVTTIGDEAFYSCDSLTSVTIPDSVTSIGNGAFSDCDSLTSVTIPDSVITIGALAFFVCDSLTSVTIPDSVTSIGTQTFDYCTSLTDVYYSGTQEQWNNISISSYNSPLASATIHYNSGTCGDNLTWTLDVETGVLNITGTGEMTNWTDESPAPWSNYRENIKTVNIVSGVTTIGNRAFYDCTNLISVSIPESVWCIGYSSFESCENLENIALPENLQYIYEFAFWKCFSIETVSIPVSVEFIGGAAFADCYSLKTITVDSENQYYSSDDTGALYNKEKTTLYQYPIGNTAKTYNIASTASVINERVFACAEYLETVYIPVSVTSVGYAAFYACNNLLDIYYDGTQIQWNEISIDDGNYSFDTATIHFKDIDYSGTCGDNLTWTFDPETGVLNITGTGAMYNWSSPFDVPWYSYSSYIKTVNISSGVTTIGERAFCGCNITNITIGNSVTTIGESAFASCISLSNITIPNSVTTIGDRAFIYCGSLTSITIPDSVTTIGDYAFSSCDSLTSVTIGNSVTTIGDYAFSSCDSLTSVTIGNGVTTIGDFAFYCCTNLTSVTIGNSVTTIGDCAFHTCHSLTSITIPDSVTTIGDAAFSYCGSLTSVTIGNSVATIGEGAFNWCTSLTSVTIPNSVTSIGDLAFHLCYNLTSITVDSNNKNYSSDSYGVLFNKDKTILIEYPAGNSRTSYTIPDSVISIGYEAFENSDRLTSVTIPDSVITIDGNVFYGCNSLTSVTIGNSVTTIGAYAFENCGSLTSVTIGNSVTTIGKYAFYDCDSLTDVYYTGTQEQWNNISIGSYNEHLTSATIHWPDKVVSENIDYYIKYNDHDYRRVTINATIADSNFSQNSAVYNHDLARLCSQFTVVGYTSGDGNGNSKNQVMKNALKKLGFDTPVVDLSAERTSVNHFITHKKIIVNGEEYTLIFMGFIGSYHEQWYSNFDPGKGATHQGFRQAANNMLLKFYEYVKEYKLNLDKNKTKFLITGHSRGAATANLVAADLIKSETFAIKENIYTYAFATPNSTTLEERNNAEYKRIFNIVNPEDFVTKAMPTKWGYGRYGTTYVLPSKTNTSNKEYKIYRANMQQYFGVLTNGEKYEPYIDGENATYCAVSSLTQSVKDVNKFYSVPLWAGSIPVTAYYFFQNSLCHFVSKTASVADYGTAAILILGTLSSTNSSAAYREILNYFVVYSLSTDGIYISGRFEDAHRAETYCAYMMSMSEKHIKQERKGYLNTINCPVDVEVIDNGTGEVVGRIINNVVDEKFAAKENAVVMSVDGDSKSFWLPSDGDYEVKLIGNDEGTMDYTVAEIDSDLGEQERINFFDVEITDGKEMTGDVPAEKFVLEEYTLKTDSGEETPDQKLDAESGEITITTSVEGDGYITNTLTVKSGDYVTLNAQPVVTAEFVKWVDSNGKTLSTDAEYSFVAKENTTVKAVFTTATGISIRTPSTTTVNYGDTLILHADFGEMVLPEGYSILWTVEGAGFNMTPAADGLTCKMTSFVNGNATVKATLVDENGEAVLDTDGNEMSDTQELKSNASFWQKIVSFFKNLFRINRIIPE